MAQGPAVQRTIDTPAALNDLSDVDTSGQATDEVLTFNGTSWVPAAGGALAFSGVRVTKGTPGNLPTSEASISFDTETFDTGGFHESVTNPSRLTAPSTGFYLVAAGIDTALTSGNFYIYVRKNGAGVESPLARILGGGSGVGTFLSIPIEMTASDYVELRCNATAASAINRLFFAMHLIGT